MDFLDSVESTDKTHRVRSWYLYEQFKSLERNQLDAAQKLKDRSYQEQILRQELLDRKARRKLYDQDGLSCQSESQLGRSISIDNSAAISTSFDDFFESFCDADERSQDSDVTEEAYSQDEDDSQAGKLYDEYKSIDSKAESFSEKQNILIEKDHENYLFKDKNDPKLAPDNIVKKIKTPPLEPEKENQGSEKYAELYKDGYITKIISSDSINEQDLDIDVRESDASLFTIWFKLVSFAYQVIQLNHGNCYYDYSSQFLTAVLACDVLRLGLCKMCKFLVCLTPNEPLIAEINPSLRNRFQKAGDLILGDILQPYVSPIKFADDKSVSSTGSKDTRKTKNHKTKAHCERKSSKATGTSKECVCDNWHHLSKHAYRNRSNRIIRSEPLGIVGRYSKFDSNRLQDSLRIRSLLSKETRSLKCPCRAKVKNPMLKIGQYIDRLLKEIDDYDK